MDTPPRLVHRVAAVLGPLLILLPPLAWWARPTEPTPPDATAQRIEKAMASDPDVVLIGASKAWTDLDPALLAKELGLPPGAVGRANMSGSRAAVWYAILENRVFGTGATPRLVVIYGGFESLVQAEPASEGERSMLLAQMGADEPVLRRKALGEDNAASEVWERVRKRRTDLHHDGMGWLRDGAVGLILGEPGADGIIAAGNRIAGPALERLFGLDAAIDVSGAHRAIPVVEAERSNLVKEQASLDDTLIPDLVELVQSHGARLLIGVAPNRPGMDKPGAWAPELLPAAVALFNEKGVGFTDLRDLGLGDAAFGDAVHLNQSGRLQMTHALAERIRAMDALGTGPIAAAEVPVVHTPPTVRRVGTPPTLPAVTPVRGPGTCGWVTKLDTLSAISDTALTKAGLGAVSPVRLLEDDKPLTAHATRDAFDATCGGAFSHQERVLKFAPTGTSPDAVTTRSYRLDLDPALPLTPSPGAEAWWVYPGTTVELQVPEAWGDDGPFGVQVAATAPIPGEGATVEIVGQAPVPLVSTGVALHAELTAPAPTGPWTVRITSPADGPWLLLRSVTAGDPEDPTPLINAGATRSASLRGPGATWKAPPAPLPEPVATPADGLVSLAFPVGSTPDIGYLARVGGVNNCSAVAVTKEDGSALQRVARRADVLERVDSFAPAGTGFLVNAPGAKVRGELDPKRDCHGLRWLYPGDAVTFVVPKARLAALLTPGRTLEIAATLASPEPTTAQLHVRLLAGDEVLVDADTPLDAFRPGSFTATLARPVVVEDLRFELSTPPGAPYFLLTNAVIRE